jgi:hypothetical protein
VHPRRRSTRQEGLHRLAMVDTGPIPDDQQLPRNLAQQLAHERHDGLPRA